MITDEDIRRADENAKDSKYEAEEVRKQAASEHREAADREVRKAEELEY